MHGDCLDIDIRLPAWSFGMCFGCFVFRINLGWVVLGSGYLPLSVAVFGVLIAYLNSASLFYFFVHWWLWLDVLFLGTLLPCGNRRLQ